MGEQTAPSKKWGEEEQSRIQAVHIDHKGTLNPTSDNKHHWLVVIDAFLRFVQMYPVKSTAATHVI